MALGGGVKDFVTIVLKRYYGEKGFQKSIN